MIERPSSRKLIQDSLKELLKTKTIEEITVTQIAGNCAMSARAFYYHFHDKHEVVSSIYSDEMRQYMSRPLDLWYEQINAFFGRESAYFKNSLVYTGQNNLMETIKQIDREKILMHIKSSNSDDVLYKRILMGLEYMLCGNAGLTYNGFLNPSCFANSSEVSAGYSSLTLWEILTQLFPPIMMENLSLPVVNPQPNL
ncbi:MAG: TetR/AcrR family transcriptional regulator [Oscillospiraceae bacterium]